jgi:hypothetical protein
MEELKQKAIQFYNDITQNGKVNAASFRQSAGVLSGVSFGKGPSGDRSGMIMGLADFITYLEENVCPPK